MTLRRENHTRPFSLENSQWSFFHFENLSCVCIALYIGTTHKLIGNALPISARVGKAKLAMNLVHIGKISCLCLLSTCLCVVFMVLRASIRQYIPDLLPNRLCRLLQISAKHCQLVSVPPLNCLILLQRGHNWHLGKIDSFVDFETTDKNTQIKFKSEVKVVLFKWMKWDPQKR